MLARSNRQRPLQARSVLGTAALVLGTALLCLGLVADSGGQLPFRMPPTWYTNRPLWYFFALASVVVGVLLLKRRRGRGRWHAARPGVRFHRVVLYTRSDCPLCQQAKDVLGEYADYLPEPEEVDVDENAALLQKYGLCVPVVEMDGKVRFRGGINEILLQRLIEGTPPVESKRGNAK